MLHRFLLALTMVALPASMSAQTVTRFEQNDPRITYTGTWYPDTNPLESGGSAVLANLKGSQAIVIFNGTGISWIGESDGYSGICYLTLDGVPTQIDTSNAAASTLYQQTLFAVHGLAAGLHRMTIEIIHSHDETSNQSWIWVDAFDIDNGSLVGGAVTAGLGLAQQTDVAANYSGHWFQTKGAAYSGGSVNSAVDAGAHVDFTFNGTAVTWIGYRDQWSGIAQVLVDGVLQATVDTYLNPSQAQTPTYSVTGLSPGTHVLTIMATGTQDASSGAAWIWVDGFQVSNSAAGQPAPVTVAGVVNAASFAPPSNAVAPGQLVSIFGQNFLPAGSPSATAGGFPLPMQLGSQNTTVTACGHTFALFIVSATQINAQVPLECPATGTVNATVTVGSQTATQNLALAPASPGIFTTSDSGLGDGVIVHADYSLVNAASPAKAGETVVIYATGLGPTTPQFTDGAAANQMNNTTMPVTVTIGGMAAKVVYAGLAQDWVGLYQINAIVPSGLTTGSQPVVVTVGGSYSSPAGVTMSIQ